MLRQRVVGQALPTHPPPWRPPRAASPPTHPPRASRLQARRREASCACAREVWSYSSAAATDNVSTAGAAREGVKGHCQGPAGGTPKIPSFCEGVFENALTKWKGWAWIGGGYPFAASSRAAAPRRYGSLAVCPSRGDRRGDPPTHPPPDRGVGREAKGTHPPLREGGTLPLTVASEGVRKRASHLLKRQRVNCAGKNSGPVDTGAADTESKRGPPECRTLSGRSRPGPVETLPHEDSHHTKLR
jgi:hypothetical protein